MITMNQRENAYMPMALRAIAAMAHTEPDTLANLHDAGVRGEYSISGQTAWALLNALLGTYITLMMTEDQLGIGVGIAQSLMAPPPMEVESLSETRARARDYIALNLEAARRTVARSKAAEALVATLAQMQRAGVS